MESPEFLELLELVDLPELGDLPKLEDLEKCLELGKKISEIDISICYQAFLFSTKMYYNFMTWKNYRPLFFRQKLVHTKVCKVK